MLRRTPTTLALLRDLLSWSRSRPNKTGALTRTGSITGTTVATGTMPTRLAAVATTRALAAPPGMSAALAVAAPPAPMSGLTLTATPATGTGATRMVAAGMTLTAARPGMSASPARATPPDGLTPTTTAATGTGTTWMVAAGMTKALALPLGMSAAPAPDVLNSKRLSRKIVSTCILAFSFPKFQQLKFIRQEFVIPRTN